MCYILYPLLPFDVLHLFKSRLLYVLLPEASICDNIAFQLLFFVKRWTLNASTIKRTFYWGLGKGWESKNSEVSVPLADRVVRFINQ